MHRLLLLSFAISCLLFSSVASLQFRGLAGGDVTWREVVYVSVDLDKGSIVSHDNQPLFKSIPLENPDSVATLWLPNQNIFAAGHYDESTKSVIVTFVYDDTLNIKHIPVPLSANATVDPLFGPILGMSLGTVRGRDTVFIVLQDDTPSTARIFVIDVELAQIIVSDNGYLLTLPPVYRFVNSGPNAMAFDGNSSVLYLRSIDPQREIIVTIDVALAVPGHTVQVVHVTQLSFTDPSRSARYFPSQINGTVYVAYSPLSPWALDVPNRRERLLAAGGPTCPKAKEMPDSFVNQISFDSKRRILYQFGVCFDENYNYLFTYDFSTGKFSSNFEEPFKNIVWPWALLYASQ